MLSKIGSYASIFLLTFFWSIYRASAAYSFELRINDQSYIIEELPQDFSLRFPSEQWIEKLVESEPNYSIQVIPASDDRGMGIGIFNCKVISPDCLIASFSALDQNSAAAQNALRQHQLVAAPITLAPEVKGYLREGSPSETQNSLSSVVWLQDNQLHAIRFPSQERQLGLYLARSMATSTPIKGQKTITLRRSPIKAEPVFPEFNPQVINVEDTQLIDNWIASLGAIPPDLSVRVPEKIFDFNLDNEGNSIDEYSTSSEVLEDHVETSLYSCQNQAPECLIGIFSSSKSQSEKAQLLHEQHEQFGHTITLHSDVKAYVFNSVDKVLTSMSWKQNDHIYGLKFPIAKRQNMLFAALSMVNGSVLTSENTASLQTTVTAEPDMQKIRGVEIFGSTVFKDEELAKVIQEAGIQPLRPEGSEQEVELSQLVNVATGVTQLYVEDNYITSRIPTPTDFSALRDDLIFPLEIFEGKIENIKVEYSANSRQTLNESYISQRVDQSSTSKPLNVELLEEQSRLLGNDDNIANLETFIKPTGEPGLSDIVVRITEAPPWQAKFIIDNSSPPRIGSERYGFIIKRRNFTGIGDSFSTSYFRSSTGGSNNADFRYTLPINRKDGTLQFFVAPADNEITEGRFQDFGLRGESVRYGVQLRQPLFRSFGKDLAFYEEFALSLGFARQTGQTFVFDDQPTPFGIGPEEDGTSRTSVVTLGQEYYKQDSNGAWIIDSKLNIGTGLFGVTSNPLPTPDGHFFSWLIQAQRRQKLNSRNLLVVGADLQLTPNTLLSSQQFPLGGGQSLPGFRQNVRSGDNGFRLFVEDRVTLTESVDGQPKIQLAPFIYAGAVWNTSGNPNIVDNQRFLASVGVAGIWDVFLGVEGLKVQFNYAIPLVDLEDRGNNAQDDGFHFQMEYQTK